MCGRFVLYSPLEDLYEHYQIKDKSMEYNPRFNIAPSQSVLAVVNDGTENRIGFLKWGLVPSWSTDSAIGNRMINARAETIDEKPSFRNAYRKRRCLIPVNGFYEWVKDGNIKIPKYIHIKDRKLFSFAGLWERWTGPQGESITSCTIITTSANDFMIDIHHRMPVILNAADEMLWLDRHATDNEMKSLLTPYPSELMNAYRVSNEVNSPKNDHKDLIKKLA